MTVNSAWLFSLFLIAVRLSTVFLFAPVYPIKQLPVHARMLFIFAMSLVMSFHLNLPMAHTEPVSLVVSGLSEFANGLILSLFIYAAVSVLQITGQLIDNQMGLNTAAIFNPTEHHQDAFSSRLLIMLTMVVFFATEGHHRLLMGLLTSFKVIPPGSLMIFDGFNAVFFQFGSVFVLAFTIASPVVIALLTVELIGAVLTRNMPQVNTYFLTLPIRILMGMGLLIIILGLFSSILSNIFNQIFAQWQRLMI